MSEDIQPRYTKSMIEWRRNKVLHRLTMGWSQAEIAEELKLHKSTISLDVQFLKEQAKEELQTHISDRLPFEYNRAVTGINSVLKRVSELVDKAEETRTKIECLKLMMELYRSIMSMTTDGEIFEKAMKMVKGLESKSEKAASLPVTASDEDVSTEDEDIPNESEEDLKEEE
jgi:transcriptional regulator